MTNIMTLRMQNAKPLSMKSEKQRVFQVSGLPAPGITWMGRVPTKIWRTTAICDGVFNPM